MARNYENERGTSRGRGQSRGRSTGSTRNSSRASGTGHTGRSYSGSGRYSNYKKKKKRSHSAGPLLGGVFVIALLAAGIFSVTTLKKNSEAEQKLQTEATTAVDPNRIAEDVYLDYSAISKDASEMNLKGMNEAQVVDALKQAYSWDLVVTNENPNLASFSMPNLSDLSDAVVSSSGSTDNEGTEEIVEIEDPYEGVTIRPTAESFAVPDLIEDNIALLVSEIFEDYQSKRKAQEATAAESTEETKKSTGFGFGAKKETESAASSESSTAEASVRYVLALPDFTETVEEYASQLALVWKMAPKNGDITSYDSASGEFVFGGSIDGYEIQAAATASKILEAIQAGAYDSSIQAVGDSVSASSSSIKDKYKIIASFTTKTTANSVRNTNVKLAAAAVNGTVLKPGEEFSFNDVVGERTQAKGYGAAAAYNAGEVVQEIGGGVCQVSSTIYNAVFRAGLTTTYRRSHTFEPSYVKPGSDATVSWGGPDYKFMNISDHAIGIRAWYKDQTCTVQIYGIPVIPDGETWDLVTEKVETLPVPEAQIITPEEGTEYAGSAGSRWVAYKVVTKKDGTVEKTEDHKVTYKGHTPRKYAEGTELSTEETGESDESTAESGENTSEESEADGPTVITEPTAATTAAVETTAAETSATADAGVISAHPGEEATTAAAAAPTAERTEDTVIEVGP